MENKITMRRFLKYMRRKWYVVLLFIIICSIICGVYAASQFSDEDNRQLQESKYDIDIKIYNSNILVNENAISDAYDQIEEINTYNQESIYINLDPSNVYIHELYFNIDTDYVLYPQISVQSKDMTGPIADAYAQIINDENLYSRILDIIGREVESKYISEIITAKADTNIGSISISVKYSDAETAKEIADAAYKFAHEEVSASMPEHTANIISEKSGTIIDKDLEQMKADQSTKTNSLFDTINKSRQQISTLNRNKPVAPTFSSTVIKYTLFGSLLGLILSCFWILIKLINDLTIHNADEINALGFPVFGTITPKTGSKKKTFKYNEKSHEEEFQDSFAYVVASTSHALSKTKSTKLLLAYNFNRDLAGELSAAISDTTGAVVNATGSLTKGSQSLDLLSQSDSVVFIVALDKTESKDLLKELALAKEYDTKILGIILTSG